jgi:hypothetical protein
MKTLSFQFFLLTLYTMCVGSILIVTHASFVAMAALLSGGPLLVLWHRVQLRSQLIPLIALGTLFATALLELTAYTAGLWYEIDAATAFVWGGVPIASYLFSFLHVLYCIVVYEYFFDDKKTSGTANYGRQGLVLTGVGYTILAGYLYVKPTIFFDYPFVVLLAIISAILSCLIIYKRNVPHISLMWRSFKFAVLLFPISFVYECVMIVNGIRFFANDHGYMYIFHFGPLVFPVEELFLLLLVPFGVSVLYELYFDDSK